MKKLYTRAFKHLFLFVFLLTSVAGWGQNIFISQYIETNSGTTPKGIEVMNPSTSDIVFSETNNLQVYQGANGAQCTSIVNITSGTLKAGEVWVIGTPDVITFATNYGTALSGTTEFAFAFNGDDALQIHLAGVLKDVFGTCGNDPGSSWSGSNVSTANNNLQIKTGICSGIMTNWTDPSLRFDQIAIGSIMTGFGNPTSCVSAYTVTFNANEGSGTMANQTASTPTTLTPNSFSRTGYSFANWSTNPDGSGTTYADGAIYDFSANITLYAQWNIKQFNVSYDLNGGTGTTPGTQTANFNTNVTLADGAGLSRAGYSFNGWNTNTSGTGTHYNASSSYTIPAADTTLYAEWVSTAPTITTAGTLSAVNTNYGTASSNTTFTVSAANLTNPLIITPPAGFEVSSDASSFSTSLSLGTGNRTNTTIYVRLAATTDAGTYSGDVVVSSTGVTSKNVATAGSNKVSPKAITLTGLSGNNKVYDGTSSATVSGIAGLTGIVNSDVITLTGSGVYSFVDKNVGVGKLISVSGFSLSGTKSGNYTLTQPSLTANITAKNLTVTGAVAQNKPYDGSTAATITGATLVGVISPDAVTVSGGGTFAQSNVGSGISVIANLSLGGTDAGNYSITQPTGLSADITAVSPTISANVITINVGGTYALPGANISSNSTGAFSYILGTPVPEGSITLTGGTTLNGIAEGSATLTVNQAANGNYTAGTAAVTVNVISCTPPVWEENFDYGCVDNNDILSTEANTYWAANSPTNYDDFKYNATGLLYPGYASSGIGGTIEYRRTANEDIKRSFSSTGVLSGNVYMSFLINLNSDTSATSNYFATFMGESASSFYGRIFSKKGTSKYQLGLSKYTSTTQFSSDLNFDTTYLVIIKYEIISGSNNDTFKMWILPSGVPVSESAAGAAQVTALASDADFSLTTSSLIIKNILLRQDGTSGLVDGIRVATTWEQLFCGTPPDASPKTYTWNGSTSSSWDVNCNWTPKGVPGSGDSVILATPGTNKLVINSSKSVKDFTLNGTGDFSMGAAGVLTITSNVTYGGSATAALDCASTVKITSASSQPVPPLSYGNLDVKGGDRVFSPTGEIGICGAFNVEPNNYSYTITNSTVNYKSPDPNWVMTPFTYHHLKFTGTGDFSIGYSDPQIDKTINVLGDFTQTAGTLYLGETTSKTATLNIEGNMTLTGGTLQMNYVNGGKGVVNLKGNFTGSATAVMEAANTGADFNFTGSGSQANPQQISYVNQGSAAKINFNVNSGAYVKLINQDLALGSSSSFSVKNGGTLDFGFSPSNLALNITNHVNSATFQTEANSTIKITSPEGITNTTGTGNVRTMTTGRVFDPGAIYHYIGKVSQETGNALPEGLTNKVIVDLQTNATNENLEFTSTGITKFNSTGTLEIKRGKVLDIPGAGFRNNVIENEDGESDAQKGNILMTGGRYIVSGSGTKPSLSGSYTLSAGTVEFTGEAATKIRTSTPAKQYYNVDVSGSNVESGGKNFIVNNLLKVTAATAKLTVPETSDNENPYVVTAKKGIQIAEGGQAIFKNNANLMQEKDAINTGNITMERKATVPSVQYNYWSSPVKDQPLYSLYPGIPDNKVMVYNSANDRFTVLPTSSNPKSVFAKGYSIKGSSNTDYAPALTATFVGEPHNEATAGINSILLSTAGSNYNLIGNPYPSNLNLLELFKDEDNNGKFYNVTSGPDTETPTAYFWDNTSNTDLTQQGSGYVNRNYALLNLSNGIGTPAPRLGTTGKKPNGIVKPGQGFIMRAAESGGSLTFKNSFRTTAVKIDSIGGVYFKSGEATTDKFWLTLTTPNQMNVVIALAYHPEAENSFERFDSMIFSEAVTENFYSLSSDARKLAIQSRKGDFNTEDKIPLGIKSSETGLQKISIESKYGAFENQPIYLKDKLLNTVVNLSETPYEFTTAMGVDDNRFEIVYKPGTVLATDEGIKDQIVVYRNANDFIVKSKHSRIDEVEVYDVSGRLIIKVKGGSDELRINASSYISGIYILKIKSDEKTVTKKILK